ncbi:unnamed protein product [Anisakis simplex]|uniref:UPF0160 protein (inferred by orthology to a C. elegans protein) n=1 Tax=Anisakis simplex TaxID=6269 RepID=A0A0M3JMP1_ANISI|nr:unnamed protein product [Anisakis simplex]
MHERFAFVAFSIYPYVRRLPLPEKWRGCRDEELSKISSIPDCIFVHMSGFIGGNKRREGAIQMAKRSLELAGKYKPET